MRTNRAYNNKFLMQRHPFKEIIAHTHTQTSPTTLAHTHSSTEGLWNKVVERERKTTLKTTTT